MIKAISVQLADNAEVLVYLFQSDGIQWLCLRNTGAATSHGWLECWSSKEGVVPDLATALEAVRVIVADNLKHGPRGPYIEGAHFIPGWNAWGGAAPGPISQFRPVEVAASSDGPIDLARYLSRLGLGANE
jgi:hypothetical protein